MKKGILCTVLSALLFGFTPVLASYTYEMGSTPETLTFYRNAMAIPMALVILLVRRIPLKVSGVVLRDMLLVGILGRGVTTLMLYSSYSFVGIGTATTLHFMYPVFTALIGRVFFREKLGFQKIAALILSTGGVMCFLDPSQSAQATGIFLALFSGMVYAGYLSGMERRGLSQMDPFVVSFYMAVGVSLGMLLYGVPTGTLVFALPPATLGLTAVISLCTSLLAVSLLQMGIRHLSACPAAILSLFEPVSCSIAGAWLLQEEFALSKWIGTALILLAVVLLFAPAPWQLQRKKAA